MSDAKQANIVPMANLVTGQIFDKRAIQVPFERVVAAVNEIDPDFAALLHEGKGYTLLLNPMSLKMVKENQRVWGEANAQPIYQRQPHGMYGGYGLPYPVSFGIVPNGHDRVLLINGAVEEWDMNAGQILQPHQAYALQFAAIVDTILGASPSVNRGFVEE